MAAPVDNPRIVVPFMPSLFHIALSKVAFAFFNAFGVETFYNVIKNVRGEDSHRGNSASSNAGGVGNTEEICNRAKRNLLLVPPRLRKAVLQAAHGMNGSVEVWKRRHFNVIREFKDGKVILFWRSDGTVDAIRTAEQLVSNENICIKKRFEIACSYCLEESIRALWSQMEASHNEESFPTTSTAHLWITWMSCRFRDRWAQVLADHIFHHICYPIMFSVIPRLSSCYTLLQPEDRQKHFPFLQVLANDDLRFCLYAMTKEEEVEMVKRGPVSVLSLYLDWPLQALFLETAEKMWNLIDIGVFCQMVYLLCNKTMNGKDFDYGELLEGFWNRSPSHLREHEKVGDRLRLEMDRSLNINRRKTKGLQ